MLHKWEIIRAHRDYQEGEARKRLNQKRKTGRWIKLGLTYLMLKTIYKKYRDRDEAKMLEIERDKSSKTISIAFKGYKERISGPRERALV